MENRPLVDKAKGSLLDTVLKPARWLVTSPDPKIEAQNDARREAEKAQQETRREAKKVDEAKEKLLAFILGANPQPVIYDDPLVTIWQYPEKSGFFGFGKGSDLNIAKEINPVGSVVVSFENKLFVVDDGQIQHLWAYRPGDNSAQIREDGTLGEVHQDDGPTEYVWTSWIPESTWGGSSSKEGSPVRRVGKGDEGLKYYLRDPYYSQGLGPVTGVYIVDGPISPPVLETILQASQPKAVNK